MPAKPADGTMRKVEISASMMCVDWLEVGVQLAALEKHGIDYLHWDVIDGRFAPDFTMGSSITNYLRKHTTIRSDYHLMVEEPGRLFDSFETSPGDLFTVHQECCRNLHRDLIRIRQKGARVGVAICPATPLETLDYVLEDTDLILVMTVNPGFMGQKLVPQMIRKVEKLRAMIDDIGLPVRIGVDGNVNYENVPHMVAAGADILVAGSSGLFRHGFGLDDSIRRLRDAIEQGLQHAA
jgi:ribulose-phosphate 3-epimerase